MALNHARTGRRRQAVEERALGEFKGRPRPEASLETDVVDAVRQSVGRLARRQREVVVLYYFLGYDIATIASVLGVASGTVKSALSRARSRLASDLSDLSTEVSR